MWLYIVVALLVVLGAIGGIFAGGIFTIVLLPIAAIALFAGLAYRSMAKGAEQKQQSETPEPALPHNQPSAAAEEPTTPEALADARRIRQ